MVAYFIDHDIISIKSNRKIKKKKKKYEIHHFVGFVKMLEWYL